MKKTLTTLLALAGVAMAENIDINALDVPANWELNHANSGKNGNPTLNGGKITSGLGGYWCNGYAHSDLYLYTGSNKCSNDIYPY